MAFICSTTSGIDPGVGDTSIWDTGIGNADIGDLREFPRLRVPAEAPAPAGAGAVARKGDVDDGRRQGEGGRAALVAAARSGSDLEAGARGGSLRRAMAQQQHEMAAMAGAQGEPARGGQRIAAVRTAGLGEHGDGNMAGERLLNSSKHVACLVQVNADEAAGIDAEGEQAWAIPLPVLARAGGILDHEGRPGRGCERAGKTPQRKAGGGTGVTGRGGVDVVHATKGQAAPPAAAKGAVKPAGAERHGANAGLAGLPHCLPRGTLPRRTRILDPRHGTAQLRQVPAGGHRF
ncbi:MAG: hypothetical protein H6878_07455 [Rhodobiaceae bacterium]|nr:hypothetical protein [Rhodobiaceae bacterium]